MVLAISSTGIGGRGAAPASEPLAPADPAAVRLTRLFVETTGLPCSCYDAVTGDLQAHSANDYLPYCPFELRLDFGEASELRLVEPEPGLLCFALPVREAAREYVLVGYALTQSPVASRELQAAATDRDWPPDRLTRALANTPLCSRGVLQRLLSAVPERLAQAQRETLLQTEINALSQQIDSACDEINLLHGLSQRLQLSRSPWDVAEFCVKRLRDLVDAAGHAILLENGDHEARLLTAGRFPLDDVALGRLLARFENHDWTRPLVKNHVPQSLLGADFPGLQNFIAAPIGAEAARCGWLICCNFDGGRNFGTTEANLLSSVATILGTHVRNVELYCGHDDLLLEFVRSLVSTLDAKDPYTRGHSERVALIARRLGQQLQLPDSDLDDIYLSALLHDIGKVGVDERILRKPGQLTEDELEQIQQHPLIGFQILQPLKHLRHILPGVRNHHEAVNGRGYPDRLRGDEIPLMARIIAVADAYDAMGSDRPYRAGMPLDRLEAIFRTGAGEQWDVRVIDAYFAARDDIRQLCASYSPTQGNLLLDGGPGRHSSIGARTRLRF